MSRCLGRDWGFGSFFGGGRLGYDLFIVKEEEGRMFEVSVREGRSGVV